MMQKTEVEESELSLPPVKFFLGAHLGLDTDASLRKEADAFLVEWLPGRRELRHQQEIQGPLNPKMFSHSPH